MEDVAAARGPGSIRIVARVEHLGGDALCAFLVDDRGVIRAAVNAECESEALRHIMEHVRAGIVGVQVCGPGCTPPAASGAGRDAASP